MAQIIFLGTAASIATAQRDNTSFIIRTGKKEYLLVDCPGSIVKKLQYRRIDYRKIDKIIITHHHPDHLYGISSLLHCQFGTTKQVTIYSSCPAIKTIKKLVKIFKLENKRYPKIVFKNVLKLKCFYPYKSLKIIPFKNNHAPGSFGIKAVFKNRKTNLVYTSDTAIIKDIGRFTDSKSLLIHDCTASSALFKKHPSVFKMHTNSKQLKDIISSCLPKITIPVHFLLPDKKELPRIKKELRTIVKVFYPEDTTVLKI